MRRLLRVTSESRYHTFAAPNREDLTAISDTHVLCVMVNIRKSPATPCMTLQYTATHCNTLHHTVSLPHPFCHGQYSKEPAV